LQTIKNVIAAATGFNADRGDQLTVESLPFESSLTAEPPAKGPAPPKTKTVAPGPAWLDLLNRNRNMMLLAALALALAAALAVGVKKLFLNGNRKPDARAPRELRQSERLEQRTPQPEIAGPAAMRAVPEASPDRDLGNPIVELVERVQQFAQSDQHVTANVVRLWLQESETR
jgi:flagellar biosynthesis/type III secretory pathway M-ring protein FliF/YscJ